MLLREDDTFLSPLFSPISIHFACLHREASSLNGKYISRDHLLCSFKNIYSGEAESEAGRGREGWGWGGDVVGWGGGHKDNFPSSPPLRSITQRWSLHRAGHLATWHPSSQLSPGNETCNRNQPATSHLPLPCPPLTALFLSCLFLLLLPRFSILLTANALTLERPHETTRGGRKDRWRLVYLQARKKTNDKEIY